MSPARVKASNEAIVAAALEIVAREGSEGLSLNAVAEAVGIRAPSLYKRFANRAVLMSAVRDCVLLDLGARLREAQRKKKGRAAITAMALAYRNWGKRAPHLYRLVHSRSATALTPAATAATAPVLEELSRLAGDSNSLAAARLFTAFLHGFVTMENDGEFQMGGSVDAAFAFSLETIIRGLEGAKR